MHLRHELEQLGLARIIKELKAYADNDALQRHVSIYENVAHDDIDELEEAFSGEVSKKLDLHNPLQLATALVERCVGYF